ncbi:MAG: class I poly(R)-hydroxyalkanoic acid synthase [Betaproteobacteria bacterium]|nr:class I poly(R)-hydroxyalkanoic acid synthase [Betaproteobacteria bacterium]
MIDPQSVPGLQQLMLAPEAVAAWQQRYGQALLQTWQGLMAGKVPLADKRFAGTDWQQHPVAHSVAALYLVHAQHLRELVEAADVPARDKQKLRFALEQWLDAVSPANSLAFNPEALRLAQESQGESLRKGLDNLLTDLLKGKVSQTDDEAFVVGKNVATTAGQVVFENQYLQLIEYAPLTREVHERPLLIVPPFINKFYILDLQPDNSLVRYALEQGQRVFLVSWVNPHEELAEATWDDYVEHAVIRAIDVVRDVSRQDRINILGFCVGGTILTTALAVLAARGVKPAASLTLLTTLLDFSDTGILDVFVNEMHVAYREATIGQHGLMLGRDLANAFSSLRPNDLVWNYVVGNYLKGEKPPAFDLLYWNGDSTNMPGPMYCWYLRHCYLQDELKKPDLLTVCGEKLDLSRVDVPVFIYGSREDHIVPWAAAYASTGILSGKKTFVLGASGHIAGVVNPPAKKKRSHWTNAKLPADSGAWLAGAAEHPGSWWTLWSTWLAGHGGKRVAAPRKPGNARYKPIEPAPGRYVLVKA